MNILTAIHNILLRMGPTIAKAMTSVIGVIVSKPGLLLVGGGVISFFTMFKGIGLAMLALRTELEEMMVILAEVTTDYNALDVSVLTQVAAAAGAVCPFATWIYIIQVLTAFYAAMFSYRALRALIPMT